jgi:hypothetical protein
MNKTEPFSCKWRRRCLPWHRKARQMRMRTRSTKAALSCSFRHPLPQQASSKSLPFPAILFVPRLSWLIERGDGIPPRMSGIVLTVPYRNNHLPRCDVPTSGTKANTYYFQVCLGNSCNNMRRRGARCRILQQADGRKLHRRPSFNIILTITQPGYSTRRSRR